MPPCEPKLGRKIHARAGRVSLTLFQLSKWKAGEARSETHSALSRRSKQKQAAVNRIRWHGQGDIALAMESNLAGSPFGRSHPDIFR